MKIRQLLTNLEWQLSGWTPELWRLAISTESLAPAGAEIPPIRASVPGSVQSALREAGLLCDWLQGNDARLCEWVENRHWIYQVEIPGEYFSESTGYRLCFAGLDYSGWVFFNGKEISEFHCSHTPHVFNVTEHVLPVSNNLRVVFDTPPRWLGQFGRTSAMNQWKARFYYTWDWTSRLVQTGITGDVYLEACDGTELETVRCAADYDPGSGQGTLTVTGRAAGRGPLSVRIALSKDGNTIRKADIPIVEFNSRGLRWDAIDVLGWWPNLSGKQELYDLDCRLIDAEDIEQDHIRLKIGFRRVEWRACEGAPNGADPWVCAINGRPIFLQGVNWVPIRPNFADVSYEEYLKRILLYKRLGVNILRVWGGASIEKKAFYDLCDEHGMLVWQEFPLSSSSVDNIPTVEDRHIDEMATIARHYIRTLRSHPSLILWCGGNELIDDGPYKPVDTSHPMIRRLKEVVEEEDPTRLFLVTSPSGPSVHGNAENFGKGVHWDVHGPWKAQAMSEWIDYWSLDDALFRSEVGAPGTGSVEIIDKYAGSLLPTPIDESNPLWRRPSNWWLEKDAFIRDLGRPPASIHEYVEWSQHRQAELLRIAVESCKDRFPRCGGIIIWMGHDCFPCVANTSIIDFEGKPKPAALAVSEVFLRDNEKEGSN